MSHGQGKGSCLSNPTYVKHVWMEVARAPVNEPVAEANNWHDSPVDHGLQFQRPSFLYGLHPGAEILVSFHVWPIWVVVSFQSVAVANRICFFSAKFISRDSVDLTRLPDVVSG